jgi:hypothetical protein
MMLEFLVPRMENAEESDFGSQPFWVAGDFKQRLGAGPE